jgi:hypothetical protein
MGLFTTQAKYTPPESNDWNQHPKVYTDDQTILDRLKNTFGTTDLDYAIKLGKAHRDDVWRGMRVNQADDQTILDRLKESFGTTDLDFVLKTFAPQTRKKLIEVQKSGPSR